MTNARVAHMCPSTYLGGLRGDGKDKKVVYEGDIGGLQHKRDTEPLPFSTACFRYFYAVSTPKTTLAEPRPFLTVSLPSILL